MFTRRLPFAASFKAHPAQTMARHPVMAISSTQSRWISKKQNEQEEDEQAGVRGIVSTLLHGSKAARQELNSTFSKVLARGKYVHEVQKHVVKPDCLDEYAALVAEHYPSVAARDPKNLKLCGSWMSTIGSMDTAVHIWEHTGYEALDNTESMLLQDKNHQEFERRLRSLLISRCREMMLEFAFWATSTPHEQGGIFELRTYYLKPGRMLEWETNWRRGLECRRQFCEPIGA